MCNGPQVTQAHHRTALAAPTAQATCTEPVEGTGCIENTVCEVVTSTKVTDDFNCTH